MKSVRVVAALIQVGDKFLITRRRSTSSMPLLWEFPGGKVEEGESDQDALKREIKEELGVEIEVEHLFNASKHSQFQRLLEFNIYRCNVVEGEITKKGVEDFRWVSRNQLREFDFPAPDQVIMDILTSIEG